jgi:glutamate-1-semialdehyde 2,1-aminomutase
MKTIDRARMQRLMEREEKRYVQDHRNSQKMFEKAKGSLLGGVPMSWMLRWPGPFPVFMKEASGVYLYDVDDYQYLDMCLGDTGSLFGHSPEAVLEAIRSKASSGIASMLPTEDCIFVGKELARRFGLPYWQVYMTASDANRFALRVSRQVTKRKLILVFNGCYHGSIDDTLVNYRRTRILANPPHLEETTRVVEFNDLDGLERALAPGDIACVLAEPMMTNVGIIYPISGWHDALRELTNRYGTLIINDETHTICAGPAGLTGAWNLKPDIVTFGKPVAGGFPAAVMGLSQNVVDRFMDGLPSEWSMGLGGTLSGNPLAIAALRANLEHVMTKEAFDHMIPLAKHLNNGIDHVIKDNDLPWYVQQFGARVEYRFRSVPPINGSEAIAAYDDELDKLVHLYLINRRIIITPLHTMMLTSIKTTEADVDLHNRVFRDFVEELLGI